MSKSKTVRTRFAPSPTGFMHIGNLRSALYAYLIARSNSGQFILRIEDTDQERIVEGSVEVIYQTLAACGLNHDEGPDLGTLCSLCAVRTQVRLSALCRATIT